MTIEKFEFQNGFIQAEYDLLDDNAPVSFTMSHRNMVSQDAFSILHISLAENRLEEISSQLNHQLTSFRKVGFEIKSIDSGDAILWIKEIADKIVG